MADEIGPALTPEQWRDVNRDGLHRGTISAAMRGLSPDYYAVVAIANDALAADDPRKITREDVEELRVADERIRAEWDHPNNPEPPTLRNLAAKLAALLPPV